MTLRVGVAGVHGHGRGHLDHALALQERGIVDVVAVADPRGAGEELHGVTGYADAEAMIQEERLDVAVFSTPIPTHAPLTLAALAAGAHVLLEKPPVVTVADHHAVVDAARRAERRVQVGFQSLASDGIVATTDALESGVIGDLRHIGAVGVWSRSEEYWRRAPWAGHRRLNGRVAADGVVTNPLAHAMASALAIAGARGPEDVAAVETDLWRANDMATDDTSSVRVTLSDGTIVAAGLTTSGEVRHEPYVLVRGSRGHLVYHYTLDTLHVFRDGAALSRTYRFGRRQLLEDLCTHVATGSELAVPIESTGAFTRVLEAVVTGPEPTEISSRGWTRRTVEGGHFRIVDGIADLAERAAWDARLFRELDVDW